MKLLLRFLEADDVWNIKTTVLSSLYIILFYIFGVKMTIQILVMLSIFAMFNGKLLSKLVFVLFLNLVISNNFNNQNLYTLIVSLLAIFIGDYLSDKKITNELVSFIDRTKIIKLFIQASYYIWMIFMFYKYFIEIRL